MSSPPALYSLRLHLVGSTIDLYFTDSEQVQTERRRVAEHFDPAAMLLRSKVNIAIVNLDAYTPQVITIESATGSTTIPFNKLVGVSIVDLVAEQRLLVLKTHLTQTTQQEAHYAISIMSASSTKT